MSLEENSEIMGRLRDVLLEVYRAAPRKSASHAAIEEGLEKGALHLRFTIDLGDDPFVSCVAVGHRDGKEMSLFRFKGLPGAPN
jgi:hypothetical protein